MSRRVPTPPYCSFPAKSTRSGIAPVTHWIMPARAAASRPPGWDVETPPAITRGRRARVTRSARSASSSAGTPVFSEAFPRENRGSASTASCGSTDLRGPLSRTCRRRYASRTASLPGRTTNRLSAFAPVSDRCGSTWNHGSSPFAFSRERPRVYETGLT